MERTVTSDACLAAPKKREPFGSLTFINSIIPDLRFNINDTDNFVKIKLPGGGKSGRNPPPGVPPAGLTLDPLHFSSTNVVLVYTQIWCHSGASPPSPEPFHADDLGTI